MDWETFTQRWNDRRLRREAKELRRAQRTAMIVLVTSAALALFIIFRGVWEVMA